MHVRKEPERCCARTYRHASVIRHGIPGNKDKPIPRNKDKTENSGSGTHDEGHQITNAWSSIVGHNTMAKQANYYVRLGFTRATPTVLVDKGRTIVSKMTDNITYPTPIPALAAVTAACDALDTANQAHLFNGGKLEREARDTAYTALKDLLRELGGYVQALSGGDKDKILSAGMDVRQGPAPIGQLPAPGNVRALVTPYAGRIDVKWNGVRGRSLYEVYVCDGDPNVAASWSMLALTSKNRFVAEGLTSDRVYYFRVVAQGAAGASPVSDLAKAKAA